MTILRETKTFENLQTLMAEVSAISLALSGKTGELAEFVQEGAPKHAAKISKYLQSKNAFEKETALVALSELEKNLEAVDELELKIAFNPRQDFVTEVFDWAAKNIGNNIVLSFKKDPSIVAGAVVTYKGRYSDHSAEKKLGEALVELKKGKEQ